MKNLLIVLVTIIAVSCGTESGDASGTTEKTSLTLITGVNFRQNFDDPPMQLGNPNVLVNNKFVLYPNPCNNMFIVMSDEIVTDVWVVPAFPQKIYQNENFNDILNPGLYTEQLISSNAAFGLNGQSSNNYSVNIGELDEGYYRVFLKVGGEIYWDNIYKNDDQGGSEEEMNAIINFWD